jgi:superfamily II DNA or RNA helicase
MNVILSKNSYLLTKEGYLINKENNKDIILNIKNDLTVAPFMSFNKNIKVESFPVYQENDDYICIPKYYGIKNFGIPKINKEIIGESVDIKFTGNLRGNQLKIIDEILPKLQKDDGGLLSLGCGGGKTVLSLYIASIFKVKTLVIVHKSFLLNQWIARAKEFTNAEIGIIQRDKVDIDGKQIVIGMLQSISKERYDSDIFSDFGLVIFDEAHHAPSKYFSKSLPIIACKKTLALSATPKRADKLEKVLYWYFGDIIYKAPTEEINNVIVNIINYNTTNVNFKEFKQNYGKEFNRPKTINKITEIDIRNIFIIKQIREILLEDGRKILILSDRIEHLKLLKDSLDNLNITTTSFYIGGLKQKILDESEKAQVIFASYSMAAEALDIPTLNTLIMTTPRKEVEQAVGRITRKKDHPVQPTIIDIVDNLNTFNRQGQYRQKFYSKKKFQIKLINVKEDEIIDEKLIENIEIDEEAFLDEDNFIDD